MARLYRFWRRRLVADLRIAVARGELPVTADPEQLAYELIGAYLALNQAIQLERDSAAPDRTRRAVARLLATG